MISNVAQHGKYRMHLTSSHIGIVLHFQYTFILQHYKSYSEHVTRSFPFRCDILLFTRTTIMPTISWKIIINILSINLNSYNPGWWPINLSNYSLQHMGWMYQCVTTFALIILHFDISTRIDIKPYLPSANLHQLSVEPP